ncbi:MAG: hypothetical protein M9962_12445 [Oligoflexia bacterium]|nr:hypothetical protein [Oligoflexia bacterium]
MKIFCLLISILLINKPSFSLVDSVKVFSTKIENWKILSHHMDTGNLRSCSAEGKISDLEIYIVNSLVDKTMNMTFRFVKGGKTPGPSNLGDQRKSCGLGEDSASMGTWRYNPNISGEEFCDGKIWVKPTEKHFKGSVLLLDEKEVATAKQGASFKTGTISGKTIFFEYSAWFQNVLGLNKKLSKPGKIELRINDLKTPIVLENLNFDKVAVELARCEREAK